MISESVYIRPRATTTEKYRVVGRSTSKPMATLSRIRYMTVFPDSRPAAAAASKPAAAAARPPVAPADKVAPEAAAAQRAALRVKVEQAARAATAARSS